MKFYLDNYNYVFDKTNSFWLFSIQNLVDLKIYWMYNFDVFQYFYRTKTPTNHLLPWPWSSFCINPSVFFLQTLPYIDYGFEYCFFLFLFILKDPPSSKPTNPSISKTQYGLLVKWTEPLVNPGLVRGYKVSYKHADRPMVRVIIVSANENAAFINTRSYPGCLYEVWISAIGETVDSEETNHIYSYSGNSIC